MPLQYEVLAAYNRLEELMAEKRAPITAPELLLKIVLVGTQSHYESRGLIDDKRLEHLLHAGKQILYKSHQESDVRQNLGFSPTIWTHLTSVLHLAIPVLESQSFAWKDDCTTFDDSAAAGTSSSDVIALNYFSLIKDIERLNDLCTIARNLLATTRRAQNLAAEKAFDQQILKLIDVCVRVTARGFDGETNPRNEERWGKIVNLYKRLLITCLQFLHNFIMHNEHRKLVLWLDLFGNTSAAAQQAQQNEIQAVQDQINAEGKLSMAADVEQVDRAELIAKADQTARQTAALAQEINRSLQEVNATDLGYNIDDVHALFDLMSADRVLDPASQDRKKALMDKIRTDLERMSGLTATQLDSNPDILLRAGAALREHLALRDLGARNAARPPPVPRRSSNMLESRAGRLTNLPELASYASLATVEQEITSDDLLMPRTSDSAAETLQEAKDELMARLQDNLPVVDENGEEVYDDMDQNGEGVLDDDVLDDQEESIEDEEEDEEEEDYQQPGDQERGLLTDVPLVLGPTEIEALPMIIQAGIVDNFGMKNNQDRQGVRNMQAVRCHILLAQEAGRNVLRELLIFIAAWDLPDDEFYFKMMVQIMEAILKNGLMSHAYSDFGQAKDIISPAQAVVIKILTHIFRTKYSPGATNNNSEDRMSARSRLPASITRVDVLTVRYIFTVFRGNIIPETCALIYLQGQIRDKLAVAEDFPLNLWDMERVYEGVYQFLEFFAVLTESNDWKKILIEWEIVYDLVTLIKELDFSIPKSQLISHVPLPGAKYARDRQSYNTTGAANPNAERPYDPTNPTPQIPPLFTTGHPIQSGSHQQTHTPKLSAPTTSDDPSKFEWRNLKKLIILVLSSLVWKSPTVQEQIRLHDGVGTVLSCTMYDGHNPYIKEHAVMCLKFLLDGNKENQDIVRELEAQGIANRQELQDQFGIEAELRNGQVHVEQPRVQTRAQQQMAQQAQMGQRTYDRDDTYYTNQPRGSSSSSTITRPLRRFSEGQLARGRTTLSSLPLDNTPAYGSTADKITAMTERFNRLDIGNFAGNQNRGINPPISSGVLDAEFEASIPPLPPLPTDLAAASEAAKKGLAQMQADRRARNLRSGNTDISAAATTSVTSNRADQIPRLVDLTQRLSSGEISRDRLLREVEEVLGSTYDDLIAETGGVNTMPLTREVAEIEYADDVTEELTNHERTLRSVDEQLRRLEELTEFDLKASGVRDNMNVTRANNNNVNGKAKAGTIGRGRPKKKNVTKIFEEMGEEQEDQHARPQSRSRVTNVGDML